MIPWYIITSQATRHIIGAQRWLFEKYLPGVKVDYLDLDRQTVGTWCTNVLDKLPPVEYCVLGLDDYLPTGPMDFERFARAFEVLKEDGLDRFELGWGASRKKPLEARVSRSGIPYLCTTATTSYSVSAQFAIWEMKKLRELLNSHGTPWHWEVKGECVCGCFKEAVFKWLESSALSGKRWPGKTNVLGLNKEDIKALEELELIRPPYKELDGPPPPDTMPKTQIRTGR